MNRVRGLKGVTLMECVICLAVVVIMLGIVMHFWSPLMMRWRNMQSAGDYAYVLDTIEVSVVKGVFEEYYTWAVDQRGIPAKTLRLEYERSRYYVELSLMEREGIDYRYGVPLWVSIFNGDEICDGRIGGGGSLLMEYPLMKRREQ